MLQRVEIWPHAGREFVPTYKFGTRMQQAGRLEFHLSRAICRIPKFAHKYSAFYESFLFTDFPYSQLSGLGSVGSDFVNNRMQNCL